MHDRRQDDFWGEWQRRHHGPRRHRAVVRAIRCAAGDIVEEGALDAVAKSFFQLLKRERIRRRTYLTRDAARQDVFDYIEIFYNPTRKHTNNGMLSPVDYEIKQRRMNEASV